MKFFSTKKVTLFAVFVALCTLANIFDIELSVSEKLSLVLTVCSISGFLTGMVGGFLTGFLGDAVGFLIKPSGNAYTPFIGIGMGFAGLIPAIIVFVYKRVTHKKITEISALIITAISSVLVYVFVTCGINTFVIWKAYISGKKTYKVYLLSRMITQLPNSVANAFLSCFLCCLLVRIPYFKQFFYVDNTENDVKE